jgi:hypothetical protein
MTTTLATSSGIPSLCIGTLLAIASPGSDTFISSMSSLEVQVLYLRVSHTKKVFAAVETYLCFGVGIIPVAPIMAGAT